MNDSLLSPPSGGPDSAHGRRGARAPLVWIIGMIALVVAAATLWLASGTWAPSSTSAEPTLDMDGNAVVLEDPVENAATLVQMNVVDDEGVRFTVPSVGLDVPLGGLDMVGGEVTPPGFTSAYTVRNLGTPEDPTAGTTYVVMHSIPDPGVAPGNYLIDVADGRAAVSAGEQVHVGDALYVIDSSYSVDKKELSGRPGLWEERPGRLVIITCQQLPTGARSVQNTVIEAHLVVP